MILALHRRRPRLKCRKNGDTRIGKRNLKRNFIASKIEGHLRWRKWSIFWRIKTIQQGTLFMSDLFLYLFKGNKLKCSISTWNQKWNRFDSMQLKMPEHFKASPKKNCEIYLYNASNKLYFVIHASLILFLDFNSRKTCDKNKLCKVAIDYDLPVPIYIRLCIFRL